MKRQRIPFLLLFPLFCVTALLVSGAVTCVIQSFGVIPSLGLKEPTLFYFKALLRGETGASSGNLLQSTGLSLLTAFLSAALSVIGGVSLSLAMIRRKKPDGMLHQALTIPIMLPHLVAALFTIFLFSQSGILARLLFRAGIISSQTDFPDIVYGKSGAGVLAAYLWKGIPFVCFFVLPVMKGIDKTLYEAAETMGAGRPRIFFHITLPQCLPSIFGAFFILLCYNFGAYELPFLLGATTPKALPVQTYVDYMHPDLRHRPYAMAMNTAALLVSVIFAFLWRRSDAKMQNEKGGN